MQGLGFEGRVLARGSEGLLGFSQGLREKRGLETVSWDTTHSLRKERVLNGHWCLCSLQIQPEDAPVVLWLQGGPGGSSMFGLFVEHGPYVVLKNMTCKYCLFSHGKFLIPALYLLPSHLKVTWGFWK